MIAKIMKGSGFKGVINYILDPKKGTELIDSSGVRTDRVSHIIQSFIDQTNLNPRVYVVKQKCTTGTSIKFGILV